MNIDCPVCGESSTIYMNDMPESIHDDIDHQCKHCTQEMTVGWVKDIEVKTVTVELGDIL